MHLLFPNGGETGANGICCEGQLVSLLQKGILNVQVHIMSLCLEKADGDTKHMWLNNLT